MVGVGAALLVAAVGCGGGDGEAAPTMAPRDADGKVIEGGSGSTASKSADDADQTVVVVMKDNRFEPQEISVEPGTVAFEVKNEGSAIHNVHVMSRSAEGNDYMSKHIIEGGTSDKFTAVFTKSGTIKFQCDFHLPDMIGTINVK
jgi:plastocyanin